MLCLLTSKGVTRECTDLDNERQLMQEPSDDQLAWSLASSKSIDAGVDVEKEWYREFEDRFRFFPLESRVDTLKFIPRKKVESPNC